MTKKKPTEYVIELLDNLGYKFNEDGALEKIETDEVSTDDNESSSEYCFKFNGNRIRIAVETKEDFLIFEDRIMTYYIEHTEDSTSIFAIKKDDDELHAKISFKVKDSFEETTTTTIKREYHEITKDICTITSDVASLHYKFTYPPIDHRENGTSTINDEDYFIKVITALHGVFNEPASSYVDLNDSFIHIVPALTDCVRVMQTLPITNREKYIKQANRELEKIPKDCEEEIALIKKRYENKNNRYNGLLKHLQTITPKINIKTDEN